MTWHRGGCVHSSYVLCFEHSQHILHPVCHTGVLVCLCCENLESVTPKPIFPLSLGLIMRPQHSTAAPVQLQNVCPGNGCCRYRHRTGHTHRGMQNLSFIFSWKGKRREISVQQMVRTLSCIAGESKRQLDRT